MIFFTPAGSFLPHGIIRIRFGDGTGSAAGNIGFTALWANPRVHSHTLADHLPALPVGLGLLPVNMFHLMAPDGGGRLFRLDIRRRLE